MAIWWIINDKGDLHTETGGEAIGLEIQMLAFAFSTANAINVLQVQRHQQIEHYAGRNLHGPVGRC